MPSEVNYRDEQTQARFVAANTKNYSFEVVNNPQPAVDFEDLKQVQFNMAGAVNPNPVDRMDPTREPYYYTNITTPDFKIIKSATNDPIFRTVMFDNIGITRIDPETYDESKATDYVKFSINSGMNICYCTRFALSLKGRANVKYTFSNNHTIEFTNQDYYDDVMLYDNIPCTTEFVAPGRQADNIPQFNYSSDDVTTILYMPYVHEDRFDIEKQVSGNTAYKFDYFNIPANQTITTKAFSDALYCLLHVTIGSAIINGYTVDEDQFYEHDATQTIDITAGPDGAKVIQSIKVPTLSF